MGGYAPYIWGSYGLALLVLVALLVASLMTLRAKARTLAALEQAAPRRRRRQPADGAAQEADRMDAGGGEP